jgi:hypothetical protein
MTQQHDAEWVGRQFVGVYYEVLRTNPALIHRFYKAVSQLTITNFAEGSIRPLLATGEQVGVCAPAVQSGAGRDLEFDAAQSIQQQVDASIAGAHAKPNVIDAQFSAPGGVLLLVDGDLHLPVCSSAPRRRRQCQIWGWGGA